jgi:glycosyltransferase involved in cell wall biosynthesis
MISILHPNQIPNLLSNYDVGVLGYKIMDSNFYYISNASNQLVEFLRCGLPIIVFGDSNLNEFVANHQVGFSVTNQNDFDRAIHQIINKYSFYQNNSTNLFNKKFSFEIYQQYLLNFLNKI